MGKSNDWADCITGTFLHLEDFPQDVKGLFPNSCQKQMCQFVHPHCHPMDLLKMFSWTLIKCEKLNEGVVFKLDILAEFCRKKSTNMFEILILNIILRTPEIEIPIC